MTTSEQQRQAVVEAAKSWLNTPYRHHARVRGPNGGADCATLLAGVYEQAGIIDHVTVQHYSEQWHLHHNKELYLEEILKHGREIPEGPDAYKPGNLVVFRFGRTFSHGAIITAWPVVIHAFLGQICRYDDLTVNTRLNTRGEAGPGQGKPRERRFFTLWED